MATTCNNPLITIDRHDSLIIMKVVILAGTFDELRFAVNTARVLVGRFSWDLFVFLGNKA